MLLTLVAEGRGDVLERALIWVVHWIKARVVGLSVHNSSLSTLNFLTFDSLQVILILQSSFQSRVSELPRYIVTAIVDLCS